MELKKLSQDKINKESKMLLDRNIRFKSKEYVKYSNYDISPPQSLNLDGSYDESVDVRCSG